MFQDMPQTLVGLNDEIDFEMAKADVNKSINSEVIKEYENRQKQIDSLQNLVDNFETEQSKKTKKNRRQKKKMFGFQN